ncbi:hypothetical protein KM043_010137 [Ampulex compressa]|nr:hypothetical protein KM043_010137 [Ampulex compressa]
MILEAVAITSFISHAAAFSTEHTEANWQTAVEFWTEAMCYVPRTKTVNFHGIFRNGSPRLRHFFDTLLRNVNQRCDTVLLAKAYELWDSENSTVIEEEYGQPCRRKRKSPCQEYLVSKWRKATINEADTKASSDMWNINVIFVEDSESLEEILIYKRIFEWNPREHFIVLTAWKEEQEHEHDWEVAIEEILKTFWFKYRIQNVFLNEPLAKHGGYVVHTYNPFARANNTSNDLYEHISTSLIASLFCFHVLLSLLILKSRLLH